MRKILLTILALCGTMMAWAQNDVLSAVLHHDSETKLFTGKNAFVEANAAAVDGDVITLSPGAFIEADITKSISVYGAGFENNNETGTQQTIFNQLRIGVSGQTLANVRIEGFWVGTITALGALDGFVLDKCRITSYMTLSTNSNTTISNCALFIYKVIAQSQQIASSKTVILAVLLIVLVVAARLRLTIVLL